MYYGLEALLHGAIVALVAFPLALLLFWRLTRALDVGHLALRPIVALSAAFGLAQLLSHIWALGLERHGFADEAMAGALILSGVLALLAFPLLLLSRWWQRRQPTRSSSET